MPDEYVTESGLVVHDRRYVRADDPRSWPPNDNPVPPAGSPGVGPTTSEGFGNQHVMYPGPGVRQDMGPWRDSPWNQAPMMPPPVMPWSGWPVEWATPNWNADQSDLADLVGKVSLVFGCIDLNSSLLSTMPPYRLDSDDEVLDSLPWMHNPQPEIYTGWTEAMRQLVIMYYTGEVFIWATSRYADGSVRRWVVMNPGWVETEMEGQTRRYYLGGSSDEGAPEITEDVLHIRYASWPGVPHGMGPLEALATNMFGVEAMEFYQANLAMRGGIPWGVLSSPQMLTAPQADEMKWRFVQARMSSMGAPAVLSGGLTLTPFTINPKDMALLELRQFDEARIATLLGVPPLLMALPTGDSSMTYRNAEGIYDFHWRAYLRPKAATIMEAISGWALPNGQRVEVNRDEYVRPNLLDRARTYQILHAIVDPETGERALTIDEIRDIERLMIRAEDDDDEDEPSLDTLIKLGVPKRALWEAAGIDEEDIAEWERWAEEERMADSRASRASFGNILPATGGRQAQPPP